MNRISPLSRLPLSFAASGRGTKPPFPAAISTSALYSSVSSVPPQKRTQVQAEIRRKELVDARVPLYPRIEAVQESNTAIASFLEKNEALNPGESVEGAPEQLYGRVTSVRKSSSKLVFFDVTNGNAKVQIMVDLSSLAPGEEDAFRANTKAIRRGDHISVYGIPTRLKRGQLTVKATKAPTIVSPSLRLVPESVASAETLARRRHLNLLLNPRQRDLLKLRSRIETFLRCYFDSAGFTAVSTPIISFGAGGATARPFETRASEFSDVPLSLRIAPELYLKRLVVGDMGPVYEIGPVFRNEGVDGTHNPEFTMCEFYLPYANLTRLIGLTQDLFNNLSQHLDKIQERDFPSLTDLPKIPAGAFPVIEFVPTLLAIIREKTGREITLSSPTIRDELVSVFTDLSLPLSKSDGQAGTAAASVETLLDSLASHLLEPLCDGPTWLIHQPALLSPLAKSFRCPQTGELVAARAELFIGGTEFVNCYEEENDPSEQERKFRAQAQANAQSNGLKRANDGRPTGAPEIDESYVEALEWGLPPTAGWGCGVDRLAMFFGRASKIADVLSFGSLRNVVTIGKDGRRGLD